MNTARATGWVLTIVIVGALGLALYVASRLFALDGRPPRAFALTNAPHIALVAPLPRTPEFSGYDDRGEPVQLDLGYSYREVSALWIPFAAFRDQGFVMFAGSGNRISIAPVNDIDRAAIVKVAGTDVTQSYDFPYHAHIWGWLLILVLALVTWLSVKRAEWKRDKAGIM